MLLPIKRFSNAESINRWETISVSIVCAGVTKNIRSCFLFLQANAEKKKTFIWSISDPKRNRKSFQYTILPIMSFHVFRFSISLSEILRESAWIKVAISTHDFPFSVHFALFELSHVSLASILPNFDTSPGHFSLLESPFIERPVLHCHLASSMFHSVEPFALVSEKFILVCVTTFITFRMHSTACTFRWALFDHKSLS